ncbi:Wall-associated receptor kinase [Parasponia andersonii]|uniref:Wall-associated receptor kinase n=1 Tax=Parasponia andersonii TaxID=3476 RepID=A0A2P5C609_PARAD|nr:Wall-associated receptor kinase [Parasponia andersonii]
MEVVQKFLATIITTCLVMITTTLANSENQPRPRRPIANCKPSCGEVSIPFPFGIGPGCSADDKWFEIVCNENKSSTGYHNRKPFLKHLPKVEVLRISTENSTLEAKSPIWFQGCPNKGNGSSLEAGAFNLTGSPFSFSENRNRLTVVGCDTFVYIDPGSDEGIQNLRAAGCTAVCPNSTKINSTNESCQTIIPSYLQAYSINLDLSEGCIYAFVVDQAWYGSNWSRNFSKIAKMEYVPVVLNWDLLLDEHHPDITRRSATHECYSSDATSSIEGSRLNCRCFGGYKGNPYLGTCEDIDECMELSEDSGPMCPEDTTCVNTRGGFHCDIKKGRKVLIGVGGGLGALVLIFSACGLYKVIKRREDIKRKEKFFKQNGGLLLKQQISTCNVDRKTKLFNSIELEKATDHYNANRILGEGGQGTVYKGMLGDGKIVAVKKSKLVNQGKVAEFINEVLILSQINHRNVVKLLGCCLETEVPLLVYEFIPNGTLHHYIHDQNEEFQLSWNMRLRIATEVAGALSYLHSATSFPIYHRDIKSTNILLDDKYRAKVADFGTSRSILEDQTHLTTLVSGTFGYIDPEYFRSSQFTEKSDVYSFGVVTVELLSGQKPVSLTSSRKRRSLATYFIECMEENRPFDVVDDRIINECSKEQITALANLAYRCLNLIGKKRPTMKQVATELEGIQKSI